MADKGKGSSAGKRNDGVDSYTTAKGEKRYRIRWDARRGPGDERNQQSKAGFRTYEEAKAALVEITHNRVNLGRDTVRSAITVEQYAREWLDGRVRLRATSRDNLRTSIEVHVVGHLGRRRLQDLTPADVARFYRWLTAHGKRGRNGCRTAGHTCKANGCEPDNHPGLGARSVGHVHAALRQMLSEAMDDGLIPTNPANTGKAKAARPRDDSTTTEVDESQCWTDEQARAFIDAVTDDWYGPLWVTLLGTGLRRGEAIALRWDDVDLDGDGSLTVRRSVTAVRGEAVTNEYGGKTKAARRTLTLGPDLVAILRAHRTRQTERRLAAGPVWQDDGLAFTEDDGSLIHPNRASTQFTKAADAAGLPPVGIHGCRHTHATMLLRAGVPVPAVAQRLGHENAAITLSVYSHFLPADDSMAADATSRALFG